MNFENQTFRYAAVIEYLGAAYNGFQRQNNSLAIANFIEKALSTVFREQIQIQPSSRTDTGVNAVGQVIHFDCKTQIDPGKIMLAVNAMLPKDISMRRCVEADKDFHARFSVVDKTYFYRFYVSSSRSPVKDITATQLYKQPNLEQMKKAAERLMGTHDFKAFCCSGSDSFTTVRTINKLSVTQDGEDITIEINGNAFLYKMVRTIAGLLVKIGGGKAGLDLIDEVLSSGNRGKCGKTMPPQGLCLTYIDYGERWNKLLYGK